MIITDELGQPKLNTVHCCDALKLLGNMASNSVDLIATDWPYNMDKAEWDTWKTDADYLAWMRPHLAEMRRVLKPNGSYYGFASPRLSARVEVLTSEYFNVLNNIVWRKEFSRHNQSDKDIIRGFFPQTERIIFAEQYGSDEFASGEAGFIDAENSLKARIFGEPIRISMLDTNTSTHELTEVVEAYGNVNHGGAASNWLNGFNVPTADHYHRIREYLNAKGGKEYFPRSYADLRREYEDLRREYEDLRREYEDLRREYEDLRRPFNVSADVPYTDVWDFATVNTYPGKHPCEKPAAMMQHIIEASSRPGAVVLDCFCGSGATLKAAYLLGRHYIGCDMDAAWCEVARNGCVKEFGARKRTAVTVLDDLPLFAGIGA